MPLINMTKRRRIAAIIARIQTYQLDSYKLVASPAAAQYVHARVDAWERALHDGSMRCDASGRADTTAERMLEKAMHEASLLCEPRRASAGIAVGAEPDSPRRGSLFHVVTPTSHPKTPRRGSMT